MCRTNYTNVWISHIAPIDSSVMPYIVSRSASVNTAPIVRACGSRRLQRNLADLYDADITLEIASVGSPGLNDVQTTWIYAVGTIAGVGILVVALTVAYRVEMRANKKLFTPVKVNNPLKETGQSHTGCSHERTAFPPHRIRTNNWA